MTRCLRIAFWLTLMASTVSAGTYYVSPTGRDSDAGSRRRPFQTIQRARDAVRADREPGKIVLRAGTHYLTQTLVLTAEDSGTVIVGEKDGQVVISGGLRLTPSWSVHEHGILKTTTPEGLVIDQLFIDGKRQHMARYPNYDPKSTKPYNGCAADAFSKQRAANWANPAGGYIHALHSRHWGGFHYRITGKQADGEVTYEGGWQNNRQMGMHRRDRMVENIFEELDAPGEWYHDAKTRTLYVYPPAGVDPGTATVEIARLDHLIEISGTHSTPVTGVVLQGIVFRHANRTFMKTKEPLLRSDWTIYRGGAVRIEGARDCTIVDCEFDQVGGNGVFVNNWNRGITIKGSHFHGIGASAVCFVGDPNAVRNPLFEYTQTQHYDAIDKTPGPKTDNYPADSTVEDCLIHTVSVVEKQATGVQISMSQGITIRHCSIYDTGRAGINISEGTFGGHLIEFCDVFDTVRETGDHGSFNSWGRDRFWHLKGAPDEALPELALLDTEKTIIRNSRWRCDRGWDIDLDDGSSNYEIYNNLMLNGGLKLREGFHRTVYNNITVNNGLHPHVWYRNSHDRVTRNIWLRAARPVGMRNGWPDPKHDPTWKTEVDHNLFVHPEHLARNREHHVDAHSIVGDPMFVDPARGDYRVRPESPALKLGFNNFPMDRFGVMKPSLRAIARTPRLPEPDIPDDIKGAGAAPTTAVWRGATVRTLDDWAFSAFGVSAEDGGVQLVTVPEDSVAARAGLKKDDVIQSIDDRSVKTTAALAAATKDPRKRYRIGYVRSQRQATLPLGP